jgi:c-di-GMP-binding flagellar brake protein YcgR
VGWTSMFDRIVEALKGSSSNAQLVERRGHYRVPCRRSVNILLARKAVGGQMLNLSPKGMKVRAHDRLSVGRETRLVVSGRKSRDRRFIASIDLICRVIWCKYSRLHEAYDASLEYIPAPGVDLEYVDAFFRHELGLEDLATYQRRCSRRVSTELDVTCWAPDGTVNRGAIRDLSLEGALFECSSPIELDSLIRLAVDVEGHASPIYCSGRVVRCLPTTREGWHNLGVSFTEVSDKDRAELRKLLQNELRQRQS